MILGCLLAGPGTQGCFYDQMTTSATAPEASSTGSSSTGAPTTGGSSGGGGATGTGTASDGSTAAVDEAGEATMTTGPTSGSTSTGSTGPGETTGGGCEPVKIVALVADADVQAPMKAENSDSGEGVIAGSAFAEEGVIKFKIDIPCADDYAVWGRVYDATPGSTPVNDPDSFYVSGVGDGEGVWNYGCQTLMAVDKWGWLRVHKGDAAGCSNMPEWTPALGAVTDEIKLRNREAQSGSDKAFIARLLITNDLEYTPTGDD